MSDDRFRLFTADEIGSPAWIAACAEEERVNAEHDGITVAEYRARMDAKEREPNYALASYAMSQELDLSEAEWTYVWDDEAETGGWTDPQDDGDDPILYSAQAAHRVLLQRKRPIRESFANHLE